MFKKIINRLGNYRVSKTIILLLFIVIICGTYFTNLELNNDVWFLLNHGRYVIEHGIPYIEPFTIHSGFSFVMQQWLCATIFWIIYKYLGTMGLRLFVVIIFSLITFIVYKICKTLTNNRFYLSSLITMIISFLLAFLFMVNRPQIFTCLFLLIEILMLELYIKNKNKKYLYVLPVVSLLQINMHASMWFMLFLFLLPYLIDSFKINFGFIKGEGYNKKHLFIVTILMFLAGFINPYGINAITYVFNSYGIDAITYYVAEMNPLNPTDVLGIIGYCMIFSVILVYVFYKKGDLKLRYFLLYCGTTFLAISNYRNLLLFIIGSIFPLSYYLKDVKFEILKQPKRKTLTKKEKNIQLVVYSATAIISFMVMFNPNISELINGYNPNVYNVVEYIVQNYDEKNISLYTSYNDGGYTEFKEIKSYIDPRAEVFLKANNKKEDIFLEYYNLQTKKLDCDKFLDKYKFDLLLLEKEDVLNECLNNYKLVYKDKYRKVYEIIKK